MSEKCRCCFAYGHKFIAIKSGKILGVFDTGIEAIADVSKEYPLGTFIVQECNGNESGYTNYNIFLAVSQPIK